MEDLVAVILAAGKGTRMKSSLAKVLHPLCGIPMLSYPVRVAREIGTSRIVVVVGHQREAVQSAFESENVLYAVQDRQLGTGHAVAATGGLLKGFDGDVLILCGDVPLITAATLKGFLDGHRSADAALSVLSAEIASPYGYGRIVRNSQGGLERIVEERDATAEERAVREINTGIYCCRAPFLFDALKQIRPDNDQAEYYLPDIVGIGIRSGRRVRAVLQDCFSEARGINDRVDLAEAERILRRRILDEHMRAGVTVIDPDSTYIENDVIIGSDTIIYPNTIIRGTSKVGSGCIIEINCSINHADIGNNVHIRSSCVIDESCISDDVNIGPFAHLRPRTVVESGAVVGNFVEITRTRIGRNSRACHLSYLGDSVIGKGVNIGAGAITCNFDGSRKQQTVIEDGAFIGSNASLVAPVRIGRGSVVAASSAITRDVPAQSLGVARGRQRVYEDVPEREKTKAGKK